MSLFWQGFEKRADRYTALIPLKSNAAKAEYAKEKGKTHRLGGALSGALVGGMAAGSIPSSTYGMSGLKALGGAAAGGLAGAGIGHLMGKHRAAKDSAAGLGSTTSGHLVDTAQRMRTYADLNKKKG